MTHFITTIIIIGDNILHHLIQPRSEFRQDVPTRCVGEEFLVDSAVREMMYVSEEGGDVTVTATAAVAGAGDDEMRRGEVELVEHCREEFFFFACFFFEKGVTLREYFLIFFMGFEGGRERGRREALR